MTIDINGGVIGVAFTVFTTVSGFLVWFGLNVLGKINTLSTSVTDIKTTMASMKVDQVASELRFDNKFDKWDSRMVQAEINLGVLRALSGVKTLPGGDGDKTKD